MANGYFCFKQFTLHQERCAMKVGTDGTLLGAWAAGGLRVLDVGTGTGLIALMMAQRFPQATVVGIDIDEGAVQQARENVQASPFAPRVAIVKADARSYVDGLFDAIVSNPPFFANALSCNSQERNLARHADTLGFADLMQAASRLLTAGGTLSVVVPADCLSRMDAEGALHGFFKVRQCDVCTKAGKPARRHLLQFARHDSPLVCETMVLGDEHYTELTKDFYL